ncbi:MAG TPA: phosphotransferase [Anaerolineae bacterium]|nr:phosphotransferase [Anaerolineae bacterium]HNU03680.1 phosphotransferase [Anaerolineae bacterium]
MDRLIKDRYNDTILQEAMRRYAITDDQIRPLDAFESFIYEFERDAHAYILRIGHSLRRSESLILGEVDWINYLADGGVSVARAIPSEASKLVELIEDQSGGAFIATAFVKAQGQAPWDLWTPQLYETYGETIGRMHTLSKSYQPGQVAWQRPDWDHEMFEFVERYLPESESIAKKKYKDLCAHVNTLARDRESYGLTHQDAHGSNLFVDARGQITLFDFDECAYNWFINDIAVVLFYIVQGAEDGRAFTQEFMEHFLRGYGQACRLDSSWLKEIPSFLKLREIELYAVVHRDFDVNHVDDAWCARFMHDRKARIENDIPFVDFDFESLAGWMGPEVETSG